MKQTIKKVKAAMTGKAIKTGPPPAKDFLSTGSVPLNLACSGRPNGAMFKGGIFVFVGDTGTGKTMLTLTCFAEACLNPNFANYRLVHDNPERGALMDFEKFFGKEVADRIEPPAGTKEDPRHSEYTEDFYDNLERLLAEGKPVIYVIDSTDALDTKDDAKKRKKVKAGDEAGSFGTSRAKVNSQRLRVINNLIQKTGSIVILICQSRDRIGFGAQFDPKTRAGGNAITFFAQFEMWSSLVGRVKKKVRGKNRNIGRLVKVTVKKNRINGKERTVNVRLLNSLGIDDVGSMVEYLVTEGHWKRTGTSDDTKIVAHDFDVTGDTDKVADHIVENDLERQLKQFVLEVWRDIEAKCEVTRRSKYGRA